LDRQLSLFEVLLLFLAQIQRQHNRFANHLVAMLRGLLLTAAAHFHSQQKSWPPDHHGHKNGK